MKDTVIGEKTYLMLILLSMIMDGITMVGVAMVGTTLVGVVTDGTTSDGVVTILGDGIIMAGEATTHGDGEVTSMVLAEDFIMLGALLTDMDSTIITDIIGSIDTHTTPDILAEIMLTTMQEEVITIGMALLIADLV